MDDLFELLYNHQSVYTPYLGISECIANFQLVGDDFFNVEKEIGEEVQIDSILLKNESRAFICRKFQRRWTPFQRKSFDRP